MRFLKFIGFVIVVVAVVALLHWCVFSLCTVTTPCMENTYMRGERVMLGRWAYGLSLPIGKLARYRLLSHSPQRGDVIMFADPTATDGAQAVPMQSLFISRCTAAAGDTVYVDSQLRSRIADHDNPDRKAFYAYPTMDDRLVDSLIATLPIGPNAAYPLDGQHMQRLLSRFECYLIEQAAPRRLTFTPVAEADPTTYAPIVIPRRGASIAITAANRALLCHALIHHEGRDAQLVGDELRIDGTPVAHCTFSQDYCWVESDNALYPCDSRLLGLIPQSMVAGKVVGRWQPARWQPVRALRRLLE